MPSASAASAIVTLRVPPAVPPLPDGRAVPCWPPLVMYWSVFWPILDDSLDRRGGLVNDALIDPQHLGDGTVRTPRVRTPQTSTKSRGEPSTAQRGCRLQ